MGLSATNHPVKPALRLMSDGAVLLPDGGTLFYPCSARDIPTPIQCFSQWVTDFWFVDLAYFGGDPFQRPALHRLPGWRLLGQQERMPNISYDDWRDDARYGGRPPLIRTETYEHRATGRQIRIHLHRRRGPSALRTELIQVDVFFYRGDSDSDLTRGSGTLWLNCKPERPARAKGRLIYEVLDKMPDGGLIVTDGSNRGPSRRNPYTAFGQLADHVRELKLPADDDSWEGLVPGVEPFCDMLGNRFLCVGHLRQDRRHYPTLMWRLQKANLSQHIAAD